MYKSITTWLNNNSGVVNLGIFLTTLLLGWLSGIFATLRRRPKFTISAIKGPTFCCTYKIGKKQEDYDIHRTGIALYLKVANIGSAASSIENVSVGYHWHLKPFSVLWIKYTIGWFWVNHQTVSLEDFRVKIGDNIKVYPFLTQRSILLPNDPVTYLNVGQATTGMVYFEQEDSWGGCFPKPKNGHVKIKVRICDVFRRNHVIRAEVPILTLAEAKEFNPSFGGTLSELRGEQPSNETRI